MLRYLTAADAPVFDPKTSTREKRETHEATRFDFWAKRVSSVVIATLARPDSSGRVGLLGFSLGGYAAAATGARDERVAALGVLYGGMPDAMVSEVKHLPPLIELHGTADRNVPPAKGEELVKLGKAVGTEAEFVVYPGRTARFRLFRYRSNDRKRSRPHRQIFRNLDSASAEYDGNIAFGDATAVGQAQETSRYQSSLCKIWPNNGVNAAIRN